MQNYHVIGLMSGTSLDGVDLAYCKFIFKNNSWEYQIIHAKCIQYDQLWKKKLANAENENALAISMLDVELGKYFAILINNFIEENNIRDYLRNLDSYKKSINYEKYDGYFDKESLIALSNQIKILEDSYKE